VRFFHQRGIALSGKKPDKQTTLSVSIVRCVNAFQD